MKPSARDPDLTELASDFTVRDYKTALVALFNKKNRYPDGGRCG